MTKKKWKTLWKDRASRSWSFFCPLCRTSRRIAYQPFPGTLRHYFQVGLTAAFFSLMTWKWLSWKGMVSFIPFWIVFEAYYRARMRTDLNCPHCGFDPYLYLIDNQKALVEIENHWRKKFEEKGIPFPEKKQNSGFSSKKSEKKENAQSLNFPDSRLDRS